MRMNIVITILFCCLFSSCQIHMGDLENMNQTDSGRFMTLSVQMLEGLRDGADVEAIVKIFQESTLAEISEEIDTDQEIYAFWINVYNAYILYVLNEHPEYYDDRRSFFKKQYIEIAGRTMSFADIEHGIIRRSQKEYFLGYLGHLFPPKYQKELRPDQRDYRVHFALNCGAKSCPPVAILQPETLDAQLNELTAIFLTSVTSYDQNSNTVTTTPLFSWFRGDFGGKKGVKKILFQNQLTPSDRVDLKFGAYDWTLALNNFY